MSNYQLSIINFQLSIINYQLKILFSIFSVLALILSQFWACSTAQSLQVSSYNSLTDITTPKGEQASEAEGSSVLLFKLLTPIKPDDNKQVITVVYSKGNHTDKTIDCLPTINAVAMPFLLADLALDNWAANAYLHSNESFVQQGYPLQTKSRGPPSLMC